jgi:hypothetical protein
MIATRNSASRTSGLVDHSGAASEPELTIIVVTWNTRELTLRCLETLFDNTPDVRIRVIVADNNSEDGSADVISERFPQVHLIRNNDDFGFARANNEAMTHVDTEWALLLNPDTETHPNAIRNLLDFSKRHREAGITGGRAVFRDGSLNRNSAFYKMTPWSLFCNLTGLSLAFRRTTFFNREMIGGWNRDTVSHVDVVSGSFFMIPTALWRKLGGFDLRFFMYGEEADLCLRAAALGYRPMTTPDAEIMHLGGAAAPKSVRLVQLWTAKSTLVRLHWPKALVPVGLGELWLSCATRALVSAVLNALGRRSSRSDDWLLMWSKRREWLAGY